MRSRYYDGLQRRNSCRAPAGRRQHQQCPVSSVVGEQGKLHASGKTHKPAEETREALPNFCDLVNAKLAVATAVVKIGTHPALFPR